MRFISYCSLIFGFVPFALGNQIYQVTPGATTSTFAINSATNQGTIQNNVQSQDQISAIPNDNVFLANYAKQGDNFTASVYYNQSGNLVKKDINVDDLKKTIVIFSGDWCPYCHEFLTNFSKYIKDLNAKGIKIIIVNVPAVDKLKNATTPTVNDYNDVKQKFESYGVSFSSMTNLVILGGKATLARNGIEGLPVFIAIKNGREYFRGVGQSGTSKLQLSDPNVLRQFLEIWDEKADQTTSEENGISKIPSVARKSGVKHNSKNLRNKTKNGKSESKVDILTSRTATELLNRIWPEKNPIPERKSSGGCTCKV